MSERSGAATASEIRDRVWQSIADRRLRPGTRLKEEELAEIFGSSRARVRQALSLLEHDRLVTIIPNRGGFVAEPTIAEARDVFLARRIIEGGLVEKLCARVTPADIARLQDHIALEREALAAGDLGSIVRLSGGFHILLAEIAGSEYLHAVLRDLVSRTSLISAMFQPRQTHDCGPDEHDELVSHIARGETDLAVAAMAQHLTHVESQLDLNEAPKIVRDLREAFG